MKIGRLAGLAAAAALATFATWTVDLKAGWGAPFACGAGPNTGKIEWDDSRDVPTEDGRAVATGPTAPKPEADADLDVDLEALAKEKPLFVYFYVDPVTDPMDENYKFSRRFELSVLQEKVIEALNKDFYCKKVSLPPDADMKQQKNQSRIEVWSPTNVKVRVLGRNDEQLLNRAPFINVLKSSVAKSGKLVKEEVARITKLRKEKELREKEKETETAKVGE